MVNRTPVVFSFSLIVVLVSHLFEIHEKEVDQN